MIPIKYLLELNNVRLPVRVGDPSLIKAVATLKAVGCVEADIHPTLDLRRPYAEYTEATVYAITCTGRAVIEAEIQIVA